ncbi:MAG TPA: oligopeptide/dipeptide ABC transporter ATP-binding protein [Chloroflexota bacterium]|nr:oligopeptide/dipeptide ABC transporter ATP-binding protein [Chloroflexota bacterium]
MNGSKVLIEAKDVTVEFPIKGGFLGRTRAAVHAVTGVSLAVCEGETLGLVGESGSGKTTLGRALLRLVPTTGGTISFEGRDITRMSPRQVRPLRQDMQMIFQDPYGSLDPRMTVFQIVSEPLVNFGKGTKQERRNLVQELLRTVGLNPGHINRYPHEFSGGQRQRVGIARALALRPKLIVADEPVSALDVSIQAQILNLMEQLQREFRLTYLFVAHNLSVVRHISDRVAVMYLGHLVELTASQQLYDNPLHPYTQALMSAIPLPDPVEERKKQRIILKGDMPSPVNPPPACPFHTRCFKARPICGEVAPAFEEKVPGHWAACHFAEVPDVTRPEEIHPPLVEAPPAGRASSASPETPPPRPQPQP